MAVMRLLRLGNDTRCIKRDIGCPVMRSCRRHADKSVGVHVVERVALVAAAKIALGSVHAGCLWRFARGLGWFRSGFEPVAWLTNAQLGKPPLHPWPGDLALCLPAINCAAGPWIAIKRAKFLRRKWRIVCFAPVANSMTGQMCHCHASIPKGYLLQACVSTSEGKPRRACTCARADNAPIREHTGNRK